MSTCEKCFRELIPLGTNQGKVEKLELFLVRFVHFFLGGGVKCKLLLNDFDIC